MPPPAAVAAALGTLAASNLSSRLSSRVPAYASLPRHHKLDLDSRLGSNVHAVASTMLAVVCVLSLWSVETSSSASAAPSSTSSAETLALAFRTSPLSFAALGLSLGYFAADLALVLLHSPALGGPEVVGHHAAALASLLVAAVTGHGHAHTLALLISECTTPFVNARFYLERAGPHWKRSRTYALNGVAMLLVWAVGRVGLFVAFFAHLAAFPGASAAGVSSMALPARVLIAVVPPLLAMLNAYWFCLIARGAWRTVSRRRWRRAVEEEVAAKTTAAEATATTSDAAAAAAAALPAPPMPPTAACSIQLEPSKQQKSTKLRARRQSSEGKRNATAVPVAATAGASSSPSTAAAAAAPSLECAILHLWSLAPQPLTALPSLPPFPSLPALPPSFQSLPSPFDGAARPFVAASDLAVALGDRVRQSQAGEALAGLSAVCRERAEKAQGFVADACAARRASSAAAFVR